ncbi:hypothetical protein FQR65_LT14054 [Abscondita terminalis]|nr:hypothetical protein FQR65_LT14054 [Abscondita terminalis]
MPMGTLPTPTVSVLSTITLDQLQFLNKIYTDKVTVDSLDSETGLRITLMEDEEPGGSGNEDRSTSIIEDLPSKKSSSQIGKRRHNKPDEVELKMLKALEPKTPCSKMSFLQSLLPHLNNFTDREFLQFQMRVLNVIENINKMKEQNCSPHPNYFSPLPSYRPVPQYMSQQPTVNPLQAFAQQQPSFSPQSYAGSNFLGHSSNTGDQNSLVQIYGPQNHSKLAPQANPPTRPASEPPKIHTVSTGQYLEGYCHSDSSTENVSTPAISPSGESTFSDLF